MSRVAARRSEGEFHARVAAARADERVLSAIRLATLHKVTSRAAGMAELHDAEALRNLAAAIRRHALEYLPHYLEQFVDAAERRGAQVHFAVDAGAATRLIGDIAARSGARLAVKSKSMTSEEVALNDALAARGVEVVETDLGEFIVQIDADRPSHIVTPIIHKDRHQVAASLSRTLGRAVPADPTVITAVAREHLRERFRRADLGITGANFAVAETGSICLCTNEGNGRMTLTRPRVHVALVGIEKIIPRLADLAVFLKLLARSSTGQPLTVYTTLITGPRGSAEPDGPEQVHIVLLDNGRSRLLGGPAAEVLACIRCGACLNACPVYRNIGGHAYGGVYPGPIGSVLLPLLGGLERHAALPRASSLCGACRDACPVKIDIPGQLVRLRAESQALQPLGKRLAMWLFGVVAARPILYRAAQWLIRHAPPRGPDGWTRASFGRFAPWMHCRDLPPVPRRTFRRLWHDELEREA